MNVVHRTRRVFRSTTGSAQHVYVRKERWAVVYRDVIDGKESQTECAIVLC